MSGLWYYEDFDGIRYGLKVRRTLFSGQSEYQKVEVFETERFGRALAIDGIYMTSEGDEFYYHEMLVHPALTTAPAIGRVLIIGGGDGGTAREVLRHPGVHEVVMVEIDRMVVEACQRHLPTIGTAWDDPRLELVIGDGIRYAAEAPAESFDVILLDGSDPVGPAKGLFNESFYRDCHRILRPGGVFALQSESPIIIHDVFVEVVTTLRRVFGRADPYFGPVPLYAAGIWSWTHASRAPHPDHLTPVAERLAAIADGCRYYSADIHRGAFALPAGLARELSRADARARAG